MSETKRPKFILGLDPSLDGTGYCVLNVSNRVPKIAEKGTITGRNATWGGTPHQVKLSLISAKTREIVAKYHPLYGKVFLERGFTRFNKSTQAVFKARGAMESELVGFDVIEIAPTTVKKAVTGDGTSTKNTVMLALCNIFALDKDFFQTEDESDAAAIAYVGYLEHYLTEYKQEKTYVDNRT